MIADEKELLFINENRQTIEMTIKKSNSNNEIVFFYLGKMRAPTWGINFQLPITEYSEATYYPRQALFDKNVDLHKYMKNLISSQTKNKNILFYIRKRYEDFSQHPARLLSYTNTHNDIKKAVQLFFQGHEWFIWGGGGYGHRLERLLDEFHISIRGFIDSSSENQGRDIEGIKIYCWRDIAKTAKNVFIAIADKKTSASIKEIVRSSSPMASVYDFTQLAIFILKNSII